MPNRIRDGPGLSLAREQGCLSCSRQILRQHRNARHGTRVQSEPEVLFYNIPTCFKISCHFKLRPDDVYATRQCERASIPGDPQKRISCYEKPWPGHGTSQRCTGTGWERQERIRFRHIKTINCAQRVSSVSTIKTSPQAAAGSRHIP